MTLFTSTREKHLWLTVLAIIVAIYTSIWIALPINQTLRNYDLQAFLFVLGMILVGTTIISFGLKKRPEGIQLLVILGIVAAYYMIIVRITIFEERSHLIEYGVLATFIYRALLERKSIGGRVLIHTLLAIVLSGLVGAIDEVIQIFVPGRVFDIEDIVFNLCAGAMAVFSIQVLKWLGGRFSN